MKHDLQDLLDLLSIVVIVIFFGILIWAIQQGGDNYGDHISAQGRLPLSQPIPAGGKARSSWEIRPPSEESLAEQQAVSVSGIAAGRETE